jgi:flagellin-like hook-associated protein FlgL
MTFVSGNIARAPSLLLSGIGINNIGRTNLSLFNTMTQLSTGRAITRPSQDIVGAAAVLELDDRLERSAQTRKNLQFAESQINAVDEALAEVTDLLQQAKSIGLTQISEGSSGEERRAQSIVIQSLIDSLYGVTNRKGVAGFVFGGSTPGRAPVEDLLNAFRITTGPGGLLPDTPGLGQVPITVRAPEAVNGIPGRVEGKVDLRPRLTADTRLADLDGGRQLGVTTGTLEFSFEGGAARQVDLTGADTVGDVVDAIESALLRYEQDLGVDILGPGGVALQGESIAIDSPNGTLEFADVAGGVVAQDLGLVTVETAEFGPGRSQSVGLSPRVTMTTPVAALGALTDDLGAILITNNGRSAEVDLSGAETIGEIRSRIESAGLGVRVRVSSDGTGIDLVNEIAGGSSRAMSVAEVRNNNDTAAALGIRTFSLDTPISELNFGRGVEIVSGDDDPYYNVDFEISIEIPSGTLEIEIDLEPGDMTTVGNVIDVMNEQIDAALTAAGLDTDRLTVAIGDTANGIVFTQESALGNQVTTPPTITRRNNSLAAIQLGLTGAAWDADTNTLVGEDRAKVRIETAFTHLIDLKEALENNDDFGMEVAVGALDDALDEVTKTRALVGGYAQNVQRQQIRQEERDVLDEQVRSRIRDVDFAQAATEFSLLQTQLQAGLQTAAISGQLTLLNFL